MATVMTWRTGAADELAGQVALAAFQRFGAAASRRWGADVGGVQSAERPEPVERVDCLGSELCASLPLALGDGIGGASALP